MSRNTLARSTLVVSAAAASSRVLGFVRDVLLATILGTGPAADAFVVAFRLPGLTRRVLGEGVLNGGVIPVENRVRAEQGEDAARILAGETLATLALGLLVVVALAEIVAPVLVLALAAGYVDDPLRFGLATDYTRLMLPLIAATALTAVAGALLNAQGRVTVAAAAPVLVNGILVAVLLALRASEAPAERLGLWLSASVSVAGVAQLVVLMIAMRQMPTPPRLVRPRWSPEIRRMLALGVPGLLAVAAGQLSVIVATQVASQTPAGVARLYYADRLFQLPLGFVAAGAGVVLLPEIVRLLRTGDLERLAQAQNRSLEWAMLLALPAAVGLAVLSEPIVSVLFEHGEFGRMDVAETARALTALAPGLPLAAAIRVLTQPFLARESLRMPLLAGLAGVAATGLAAYALEPAYGVAGIAAGVTLGALVHATVLLAALWPLGWWRPDARIRRRTPGMALASAAMGIAVGMAAHWLEPMLTVSAPLSARVSALAALCISGLALYGVLVLLTGAASLRELRGKA